MKRLKMLIAAILFSTLLSMNHPAASFAGEYSQEEIQTLKDAAAKLELTNPDLSDQLNKYADRKENGKEGAEENNQHNIKLLNHAAKALHHWPELVDGLKKIEEKEVQGKK